MLQRVVASLLAVGLLFAVPGCDSGGTNGGNGGGGDDPVVPAAPSGLEATPGDGEVSLNWDAADDAQTYNVYRDTESGTGATGSPLDEGISETAFTDETAENGTTYYYVVTGVTDQEGDPSGEAQATPEADAVVPAAPSGLEASSGDGEVSLGWDAADDAQTYNVYRDTESGTGTTGSPLDEGIGETSYTDETAENGTTYYYVVTGMADEEGDPSGEAEATPEADAVVPAAPSGLEASSGDGEVSLGWDAADDAQTYNVYRDTESGRGASGEPLEEGIEETSYTDETAENGTEYFYVVTGAADEEGDSSGEAEGAPFAPASGLGGTSGDSQVELSWEAAAGAETYNVYRDTESGTGASGEPLAEGIAEASYTDESAENGETYYYVVTSVNPNEEEGDGSGETEGTPFAPASGLEGTSGDSQVELSWEAAAGAETYTVYRSTEPGVEASGSPLEEDIEDTNYTDESAENGTEYFYVVTSVNANGEESAESGEAEGAPFAPASGLEGTSGDSQVELSWEAGAGADTYNVYRDTSSSVDASGSPLAEGVAETAFTDESGENGTTYYYVVTSVNANGEESTSSEEIEKTPFSEPPPPPGGS